MNINTKYNIGTVVFSLEYNDKNNCYDIWKREIKYIKYNGKILYGFEFNVESEEDKCYLFFDDAVSAKRNLNDE